MTAKPSALRAAVLALLLVGMAACEGQAQPYSVDWYTIDGGGGTSTGGAYTLSGTIGQPAVGLLTGGSFALEGGFWPGLIVPTPGAPTLYLQWVGAELVVSWEPAGVGFGLEMSDSLAPASWLPGPAGNPVAVPPGAATRFFRLKRP